MYSKANIKGHAIHPMLISFPVAFYTATLIAFIIYAASDNPFWFQFATITNWAGVGTAVLAAIPGIIDWTTAVPKNTRAKTRGMRHMLLNSVAFVAFLLSAIIATGRWDVAEPGAGWPIALSIIGMALTLPAGALGWELVQKDHVGVELSPEQARLETSGRRPGATEVPVHQQG